MKKKDLTLQRLKNTNFPNIYEKFLLNPDEDIDYKTILSIAIILINSEDKYIQKLGYRIVVLYCNQTNDYNPLYEIAINIGLYPISKFIYESIYKEIYDESLFLELNEAFMEIYKKDNLYQSFEQKNLLDFFNNNLNNSLSIVAPTSYGKTDLIISLLEQSNDKNICILTPTKSLLAQTKHRIASTKIKGITKIITHPEMYTGKESNIIAVLTQERLLRLLRKDSSLKFDYVIVDEAHSLLNKSERDILLASVIIMLEKRNPNVVLKFLTPFLNEAKNLSMKFSEITYKEYYVKEFIKSEKFYIYDFKQGNGTLQFYDQFMNSFYNVGSELMVDDISFVENMKSAKNIVYLNKPVDIENFSTRLSNIQNMVDSLKIDKACKDIAEYVHPQYNLLQFLKKGVIYHHGSVPDSIRLYIEQLYTDITEIDYVITNSTLLEGVNLPAERMFILDNKKGKGLLSPSNFKNLIGRVCRFSDIFQSDSSLNKLSPHIYLVNSKYYSSNADISGFLSRVAKIDKHIADDPQNVLLKSTEITESNKENYTSALEFIENYENGIVEKNDTIRYTTTEIGKACFLNNINEVPVFDIENKLQYKVDMLRGKNYVIDDAVTLMSVIDEVFFTYIPTNNQNFTYQSIHRLRNKSAQKFYTMFLNWRIKGASYSEMIKSFLKYWESLIINESSTVVFVGRWGDLTRGGHQPLWTDIKIKNVSQRINLAIVRIKEEQDFLDNVIIKYIEVLNDLGFLQESFYLKIKYGTDDKRIITLVKNGISLSLSNLIVDKYLTYIKLDVTNSTVLLMKEILSAMRSNDENQVLINEISYFVL